MSVRVHSLPDAAVVSRDPVRGLIEALRILLATLSLLVVDTHANTAQLFIATSFLAWGLFLWWLAEAGTALSRHRCVSWIDAGLLITLFALAERSRIALFPLLLFPAFIAAWRGNKRDSVAIVVALAIVSLAIRGFDEPDLPLTNLIGLHLLPFLCAPLLIDLAQRNQTPSIYRTLALKIANELDARQGFESVATTLISLLGERLNAGEAILAMRSVDGRARVLYWDAEEGIGELSAANAFNTAELALSLGDHRAFGHVQGKRWQPDRLVCVNVPALAAMPSRSEREAIVALGRRIGHARLLTVPMVTQSVGCLRLVIAGNEVSADLAALEQLIQVVSQLAPFIENASLREHLVAETAETERARIGRDLHDSAIQPYIGLKFALEALQRRAGPDNALAGDLAHLVHMANEELAAVREVVTCMRNAPGSSGLLLAKAIQRQAERFAQLFGIEVHVDVAKDMPVSRRLAGELFHIVAEGLSNIRRHTQARHASILLRKEEGTLSLTIRNMLSPGERVARAFTPISLSERTTALNGELRVESDTVTTSVIVNVPLAKPSRT